ncbi:nuclear transport factor 2 family protein [Tsuneonella mangrovi]|uniref:nuclear transport factor 2 family protein n=1 Tax=Tsuneonella mangrovi TaxID=1982042 RepID=UPI000BA20634|nr:nuclear transport factor 2 family protein [Tsuneonella mangrovi]
MFSGPLADRQEITELNGVYADGVVRSDAATWGTVWAEDATWDFFGQTFAGRDAIVAFWEQAMSGIEAVSFHCVPCMIAVTGDTATARVQTQEFLHMKDGVTRAVGGMYEDRLAKIDGQWQFTHRAFRIVAEYNPKGE